MLISVDGLDGTGKSTLAKKLAETLEFEYIERPIHDLFKLQDGDYKDVAERIEDRIYNDENASPKVKSMLTLLGISYLKDLKKNRNLVVDRGVISCYGYNGCEETQPIFKMMIKTQMIPDISILLIADKDIRMERIKKRDANDRDLTDPDILKQNYESLQPLLDIYPNLIEIDTNYITKDEVFDIALKEIKKLLEKEKNDGNIKSRRKQITDRNSN